MLQSLPKAENLFNPCIFYQEFIKKILKRMPRCILHNAILCFEATVTGWLQNCPNSSIIQLRIDKKNVPRFSFLSPNLHQGASTVNPHFE